MPLRGIDVPRLLRGLFEPLWAPLQGHARGGSLAAHRPRRRGASLRGAEVRTARRARGQLALPAPVLSCNASAHK